MKVVLQRVSRASVTINNTLFSSIGNGLMLLIGIQADDTQEDINWLCSKVSNLRIFDDENGVMNKSVKEIGGDILAVSQFTLMARVKKGNRPSYIDAAAPDISIPLYQKFIDTMETEVGKKIQTGQFGADMKVELLNDGPVTIVMDSKNKF